MGVRVTSTGKYEVTFRDHTRKQFQKTFRLKSEAEDYFRDSKQKLKQGRFIRESKETVADRCDAWLERKKKLPGYRFGTLQNYETHIRDYIKPELGDQRIQRTSIKDCEDKAVNWAAQTSANTANMVLKTMTQIFDEAQRHGVIEVNVAEKAQRLKISTEDEDDGAIQPEDVYTDEQLGALINATEQGTADRILIWLGGFCGMRIGEILAFSWPAINLKAANSKIRVIKNLVSEVKTKSDFPGYGNTGRTLKDPKKKSRRTLDAPRELVHDLRLWKLKCPPPRPREWPGMDPLSKQLVMVTIEGKPLQKKAAQAMLDAATDRANGELKKRLGREPSEDEKIPRRTLHRLRHTFASQLLMEGKPLQKVSKLLGHRDIGITAETYAHFIPDEGTEIQDLATRVMARAQSRTLFGGKRDTE
jgi:integrase